MRGRLSPCSLGESRTPAGGSPPVTVVTEPDHASHVTRFACLLLLPLAACASTPADRSAGGPSVDSRYAGTVQKVLQVVRQGADLPGMKFLGKVGGVLGPHLRQNSETHQYVVRTATGQIIAQSDSEFAVGDCVQVIPRPKASGPAFRYGEAEVVRSAGCSG